MNSEHKVMDASFMEEIELPILNAFRSLMGRLTFFWKKLGINEKHQIDRTYTAQKCIFSFMKEMEEEEEILYNDIIKCIEKYIKDLNELSHILGVQPIKIDDTMALLEKEKHLRTQLDVLVQEKHARIKSLQELRKVEQKFCSILGLSALKLASVSGVPTKTDLFELEQNVNMLKEERDRRHRKFCLAKRELTTIMETTEITPETVFERDVMCYDDDQFLLSNENLKELEEFVAKVQIKKTELEKERREFLEKLATLWDRLNISSSERHKFLAKHADYRSSTIHSIKQEIERCQEIKRQNVKSYINILQEELKQLWEKCHISEKEKQQFQDLWDNDFTEDALNMYEVEVQKLTKYYEETAEILKKIEKRQKLWDLMTEFENKAQDPYRFTNRGGNLLREERDRKKLQKDLPKLESELFMAIQNYEDNNKRSFLFDGKNFQEYVRDQWEQRMHEKENEKILRQRQRTLVMEHEMTMGTPVGKRHLLSTPKSAPSKMFRSNAGSAMFRTPGLRSRMKTPETVASSGAISLKGGAKVKPSMYSPYFTSRRKTQKGVLTEQNNRKNGKSPNATTYSDFADVVSRPSRSGLRSSVLTPRKVFGSKKSYNRSRRSGGMTSNRSLRSLSKTQPKITPVRGKLGLPFLI